MSKIDKNIDVLFRRFGIGVTVVSITIDDKSRGKFVELLLKDVEGCRKGVV